MPYREVPVAAPQLACGWVRTLDRSHPGHVQRVFPDGCVDVVWRDGALTVAGPATRRADVPLPGGSTTVGVRFRPGAAAAALGVAAHELRDRTVPLDALWPDAPAIAERVAAAEDPDARLATLAAQVSGRLRAEPPDDGLLAAAVTKLDRSGRRVASLTRELGVGERRLQRRFHDHVGYPPKTLHRILRLRRFLALAERDPDGLAGLAAASGYADQAHLTRDSRALTGLTPRELLQVWLAPAP